MTRTVIGACAAALVLTAVVTDAQRRGGGPPAGPRGGGPPGASVGKVERITVHGKSLEGNLEGDSPDRDVAVYLPSSYAAEPARRFPVVYLLHGYGGRENTFTEQIARLVESSDRLAAAQGFSEAIVVTPNAFTLHRGSLYSSSPTTGDWEKFIAEDLVTAIDGRYRTLAARMSRGLAGHSMGGYGAMRIGMKRADVFSSLYVMSACCVVALTEAAVAPYASALEGVRTREQAEAASRDAAMGVSFGLAAAAAWSPNPANPPLFVDLPVKSGTVRPDVLSKWESNSTLAMVDRYAANLKSYYAIAIDVGTKDALRAQNRQLHDLLTRLHVAHAYEEYDGDHMDKIGERLERNMLPFFSKNLVAPANPTSPQVKD